MSPISSDGISAEKASNGKYRFVYVSSRGAMHYGPRLYRTKIEATRAGREWLRTRTG